MTDFDLITSYAPILHFHPDEGSWCCFPSDAERIYEKYHHDWTLFERDLSPTELLDNTPCYYETFEHDGWTQIRYWFWYNYNRFPGAHFGFGDHLGDWEHVEVRIYPEIDDGVTIWLLSNHLTARVGSRPAGYSFRGLIPEPLTLDGNHVHVWVALGSHANYPSPTSKPKCFLRFWCDKIADGGAVWHTANNLVDLKSTNFYEFKGRWGDKKAPRSPTNGYNNPWRNSTEVRPVKYTDVF